jgi:hypothetical protein
VLVELNVCVLAIEPEVNPLIKDDGIEPAASVPTPVIPV